MKVCSYPLSAVPPESPDRQLEHEPAGPPGRHCSLDHHSALHGVRLRGSVGIGASVRVMRGGRPDRPVQPGDKGLPRGRSAWVCTKKEGVVSSKRKESSVVLSIVCICAEKASHAALLHSTLGWRARGE